MKKLVLAVPLILVFGCKKPGELYCQTHADCEKWGLDFCDVNGEYPASNGIAPTCIENPFDAGLGDGDSEDGGGTDAMAGCASHADCATGVCDPDARMCAGASTIVYVDGETGADNVGCGGKASACKSISFGVLQVVGDRRFLHVKPGTYVDDSIPIESRHLHLVAHGVKLFPVDGQREMSIEGAADVTIEGLETSGYALRCNDGSTLNMQGVTVSNLDEVGFGILVGGCQALIEDSEIIDIDGAAIDGSNITVRRSRVIGNRIAFSVSGDIEIEQTYIANSSLGSLESSSLSELIFRNNVIANTAAAVRFSAGSSTAIVEHNTIVGNAGGVSCSASEGGSVQMVGNIIYNNALNTDFEVGNNCSITYSNVEGGAPGVGNIDVDPEFLTGDYHLKESSPCVDRVPSEVTVDIDGEARPGGGMNDMGADEVL